MFNISQYLERFKNLGGTERELKAVVVLAVKEVVGIEIDTKNIFFQNGELIIKVTPAVKNSIFIKKEKILKIVGGKIPHQLIGEIR